MGQGSAPYTVWASERTGILLINSVVLLNATAAISLYLSYHLSIICHQPKNISQDQNQLPGLCQHMHGSWPLHCLIDETRKMFVFSARGTFKPQTSPGSNLSS